MDLKNVSSERVIYGLFDPRTQELRYVGRTICGMRTRLRQHLDPRNLKKNTHKNNWIKFLADQAVRPEIDSLEELSPDSDIKEAESFWIQYYRSIGCRLTNVTGGTEGQGTEIQLRGLAQGHGGRPFVDETGHVWHSQAQCARELRVSQSKIGDMLRGKAFYVGGHAFRFQDEILEKGLPVVVGKRLCQSRYAGGREVVDHLGRIYPSCVHAAETLGVRAGSIRNVLTGTCSSLKGLVFRWKDEGFPEGFDAEKHIKEIWVKRSEKISLRRKGWSPSVETRTSMSRAAIRRWARLES